MIFLSNPTWEIDLQELYLASNSLGIIHERSFAGLNNLKILVLAGNTDLKLLTISSLTNLSSLQYLDLACVSHMKVNTPNLQTFISNDCYDKSSRFTNKYLGSMLYHSKFIKNISLENNYLESLWYYIDVFEVSKVSLFKGRRSLITLDLKKNKLATLQPGLFLDLLFLQELDLSYCELFQIESKTFEGLQRLKTLYLQGNKLHGLPRKVFQNSGELATILLKGNKLRYLEHDLFVNSSKLRNLTLAGNRLSGFNRSTFVPIFTNLISIDISNNEFVCTCNLKWLPLWLSGSITLLNENDTRCSPASLEELRESPLLSFKPAELCGPNVFLYTLLPLGIICITVLLIFAYRHRWFLKCKIFLLKLAVIGYREIRDARNFDDYEFHVNIMFSEEDEGWVRDHLRPSLRRTAAGIQQESVYRMITNFR